MFRSLKQPLVCSFSLGLWQTPGLKASSIHIMPLPILHISLSVFGLAGVRPSWHRQTRDMNLLNALPDRKPMQSINYKLISDDLGARRAHAPHNWETPRLSSINTTSFPQYFGFPPIFRTSQRQFLVTWSHFTDKARCRSQYAIQARQPNNGYTSI